MILYQLIKANPRSLWYCRRAPPVHPTIFLVGLGGRIYDIESYVMIIIGCGEKFMLYILLCTFILMKVLNGRVRQFKHQPKKLDKALWSFYYLPIYTVHIVCWASKHRMCLATSDRVLWWHFSVFYPISHFPFGLWTAERFILFSSILQSRDLKLR